MFEHERRLGGVTPDCAEVGLVVNFASTGYEFDVVDVHFGKPGETLRVAGDDPTAGAIVEVIGYSGVVVGQGGAVDGDAHSGIDAEGGSNDVFP